MIFLSQEKKGFTLIELIIVISVIAVLSTIVLANMSVGRKKARDAQRISDISQLQVAYKMYKITNLTAPAVLSDFNNTTYLSAVVKDPSGSGYVYDTSCNGNKSVYTNVELPASSNWTTVCGGTYSRFVGILK